MDRVIGEPLVQNSAVFATNNVPIHGLGDQKIPCEPDSGDIRKSSKYHLHSFPNHKEDL